jgi:hypothetical protein
MAKGHNDLQLPHMTFMAHNGIIVIEANHFAVKKDTSAGEFKELIYYGRSGSGMKVFPSTVNFKETDKKPTLTYRFYIEESGTHTVEVWTTPVNPAQSNHPLRFMMGKPDDTQQLIIAVPSDFVAFHTDSRWCRGVLDNIRKNKVSIQFKQGIQEIAIAALEAGLIIERVLIYMNGTEPLVSFLGPQESLCKDE